MESLREDLIKKLGSESFRKVETARIGIAGAGGLGSNCAANLVRCGFRKFVIADFDKIVPSNLDRQFFFLTQVGRYKVEALADNLRSINPDIEIEAIVEKIEKGNVRKIFGGCDAVAECLDKAEYKSILVSELLAAGKFAVSVSGLGGIGSSDDIKIHKMKDDLIIVGDLKSDIENLPALSPRVNIAAAKQADVILGRIIGL
jgi:sulfur carrier protein ThiS adenylyltransferase